MQQPQQPAEVSPSSPLALAAIPILVVPVGRVRRSTWERYTALFGAVGSVGQSDVPLDASLSTARFFPSLSSSFAASTSATGAGGSGGALVKNNNNNAIHLAWSTGLDAGRAAGLGLLRPASQPLAVVALVDLHPSCTPSLSTAAHLLSNTLDELYPTGERPFVVRCFGVEGEGSAGDGELVIDSSEEGRSAEADGTSVTVIPKMDDPSAFLEALVGDLVGRLLGAFAGLANSLESASGMALLQQQSLPPLSLASSIASGSTPLGSRSTTPTPQFSLLRGETLPIARSSSPLSRTDSAQGARQHQQLGNGHPSTPNFSTSLASAGPPPPMQRSTTASSLRNGVATPLEAPVGPIKTSFGAPGRKRVPSAQISQSTNGNLPSSLPQTGSPVTAAATALPLAAARLASVLGSLYLLAGRLGDAQQSFLDALLQFSRLPATAAASAAAMAGGAGDPLWHGVTLEGLATAGVLIECKPKSPSLPAKDGSTGSPSPAHEVISAHLETALTMYHRATPTYAPSGESPFPALFMNAALRHARLLLVIRQRGAPSPHLLPYLRCAPGPANLPQIGPSAPSGVSRHAVAERATLAHGPWLVLLPPTDRLSALRVLVGVFRALGMRRKEGVFARMVVACLGEMIVLGRIAVAAAARPASSDGAVSVRFEDGKEGNEALLELMDRYLVAYGVDVDATGGVFASRDEREVKEIRAGDQRIDRSSDASSTGEGGLPVGWPELQLRALRDSIGLAELLPDHHSVISYALTMLRTLRGFIVPGEQAHLANVFGRALATARRRGELVEGDRLRFWPGSVVMSLELPSLAATSVPVQHAYEEREAAAASSSGAARDPFLFNPRVVARLGASTVVQNEPFDVFVTLQNAFSFPLEIQNVRLSTVGPEIVCEPLSVLLAPNAAQSIKLSAFASEPGTLTIKGCFVRLSDGSEAEFLLPLHDAAEERRQRKRASQLLDSERTVKLGGIQRVLGARAKRESRVGAGALTAEGPVGEAVDATFITCEVLPEQPTMRIRGTSLTHGALMLYAGEETKIRITLENVGHLPVDFVKLSFLDSTTAPVEALLTDGELEAGEAYELEADLARAPVFRWSAPPEAGSVLIPPRGRLTLSVTCLGKVGCSWGNVQVSYGLLERNSSTSTAVDVRPTYFHTRQIAFPILISVYHTLECTALDVLRIPTVRPAASGATKTSVAMDRKASVSALVHAFQQQNATAGGDGGDNDEHDEHCLVAIDVRNTYMQPFEVSFRRKATGTGDPDGQGEAALLSTRLVSPGSTERIVLPIRRFLLDQAHTAQPIPALGDRQFVLSSRSANASAGDERRMRTLFWYREKLMELVEAVWREPGSARSGVLPLRGQSLTEPQLEVLRADEVVIKLSVDPLIHSGGGGGGEVEETLKEDEARRDTFFDVVVKLTNRLARPIQPLVYLAPLSFAGPSSWASLPLSQVDGGPAVAAESAAALAAHAAQYFVASGLPSQLVRSSSSRPTSSSTAADGTASGGATGQGSERTLNPGQTAELRFRVGVLARGTAEFRTCVEDLARSSRSRRPGRGGRARRRLLDDASGDGHDNRREDEATCPRQETVEAEAWFSSVLSIEVQ